MPIVAAFQRLASAAVAFFGPHGSVTQQAEQRGVSRQRLYREADEALDAVEGSAAAGHARQQQQQIDELQERLRLAEQRLGQQQRDTVVLDKDKQAEFASKAQAEGVSLPVARRLLAVFLGPKTPSVAQLGRHSAAAAKRSTPLLAVLDEYSRPLVRQASPDEIFVGRQPVLMVVEPESFGWVSGRKAATRDGEEWAKELRLLPALEQVSRDAGTGLEKGLRLVNQERVRRGQPGLGDQLDHFHSLREGGWALRKSQGRAARALERAAQAERKLAWQARHGQPKTGYATQVKQCWRRAERAFDEWTANEQAWSAVQEALKLFTPQGELNTRERGEHLVAQAVAKLTGAEWSKAKRLVQRPETFTFLDRMHKELATVPVAAEVVQAVVRVEGVRRHPRLGQGEGKQAVVVRGLLVVWSVLIARAGQAGEQATAAVRGILRRACRASSCVEGLNSVLRMQQGRHRRLTQGLLDLKRLYWNTRPFRTGRRRKTTPYQRLGLVLPPGLSWWELLKLSPEQLRQRLLDHATDDVRQRWRQHGSVRLRQDLSTQQVAP
jgi:hypothetical protein